MTKTSVEETIDGLSTQTLRRLLRTLEVTVEKLGPNTPIRQVMTLLHIAAANKYARPIGVRDIDHELGDLASGSASKLLRSMMHVETTKKPGVASTVYAERDPNDLRKWDLHLTAKGAEAVSAIINAAEGNK